jgi:DNA-binding LacI/PurR family transcriptional regulator
MAPDFWTRFQPDITSLKMLSLNPRPATPGDGPVLSIGYREAGSLAAEHLMARGCAQLAVLGRAPLRVSGFQGSARLTAAPAHCFLPSETTALASWIREAAKPLGIFALTDILALKVIRLVQRLGLRVPEDVRVVGHDDSEFAAHIDPPLTTIRQSYREQGRESIRMIVRMMYGETVPSKVIQPALIARESA